VPDKPRRFELDEAAAFGVAVGLGPDWSPREPGEETTLQHLVWDARAAGAFTMPEACDLDIEIGAVDGRWDYRWLVDVGQLTLTSLPFETVAAGKPDVTGQAAVTGFLREGVDTANMLMDLLDAHVREQRP
jgi:hypothetical protein